MDTFDRFNVTISGATREKTSSTADDRARHTRYPDSEFGLVVVSGARKARFFPMSTLEEVGDSQVQCDALRTMGLLPPDMADFAVAKLSSRKAELSGGEGEVGPAEYFWEDRTDGLHWREVEAWWAEKRSSKEPEHPAVANVHFRGRTVSLRKLSDVAEAEALLRQDGQKMSSCECRELAKGILRATMAICGLDEYEAVQKLSSSVTRYLGTVQRPEATQAMRQRAQLVREGHSSLLDSDAVSKVASAYDLIADELERMGGVSPGEALPVLEKVASQLDDLDQAAGLRAEHSHRVVFLARGEKGVLKASSSEPVTEGFEYAFGSTHIRASQLERLPNVHLGPLRSRLSQDTVDKLRDNPVETFRTLTPPQKRFVARFVEEKIKIRSMDEMVPTLL